MYTVNLNFGRDQTKSEIEGEFSIPADIAQVTAEKTRLKIATASLKVEIKELKLKQTKTENRKGRRGIVKSQKATRKNRNSYTLEKDAHFQRQEKHTRLQLESAFQDFHQKKIKSEKEKSVVEIERASDTFPTKGID